MSILDGTGLLVDDWLQVKPIGKPPHYRHKSAALALKGKDIPAERTRDFLDACYRRVHDNWEVSQRIARRRPSAENWRFTARSEIADENVSPEV